MICSRISCSRTAIAALAGLAITITAATAMAAANRSADRGAAPIPADKVDQLEVALVVEGDAANDTFATAELVEGPRPSRFDIRGELSESDADGLCRDVDFYRIEGLEPLGEFLVGVEGDIAPDAQLGWHNTTTGDVILSVEYGLAGKILLNSDENGVMVIAVSAAPDDDYDGDDDNLATPHGICGQYLVHVELLVFGDVNGDARVDTGDVRVMLNAIGSTETPKADLTDDGIVDEQDLRILADTVTDRKAQRIANNKANKITKRKANAERKAVRKSARLAEKANRKANRRNR